MKFEELNHERIEENVATAKQFLNKYFPLLNTTLTTVEQALLYYNLLWDITKTLLLTADKKKKGFFR
jgi:hypothetical protein